MSLTPSQAKNYIRRSLRLLVDPDIDASDKQAIWNHFGSHCAYCDKDVPRKQGDMDHIVSSGPNGRGNRALACKPCNAQEKRDIPWREFLEQKCGGRNSDFLRRAERIEAWMSQHPTGPIASPEIQKILAEETTRAIEAFDRACLAIRTARPRT